MNLRLDFRESLVRIYLLRDQPLPVPPACQKSSSGIRVRESKGSLGGRPRHPLFSFDHEDRFCSHDRRPTLCVGCGRAMLWIVKIVNVEKLVAGRFNDVTGIY